MYRTRVHHLINWCYRTYICTLHFKFTRNIQSVICVILDIYSIQIYYKVTWCLVYTIIMYGLRMNMFTIILLYRRISVSQYVTEIGDVVSHFNITKVQVEDGGLYECIVSNRAGQVSHSAKIQVYGLYIFKLFIYN